MGKGSTSGVGIAELQTEVAERLPEVKRILEGFEGDLDRRQSLEQVRDFFHRIAGVAAPCGAPLLGALAHVTEEFIAMVGKGEASAGPRAVKLLSSALKGVEAFAGEQALPKAAPEVAAPASSPETLASKVLIVDDDPLSARLIEVCLEGAGFRTRYCRDPREAIATLDEEVPDLILLDLIMPGQDGFETCRQIRAAATSDRIPIIFLTGVSKLDEKVEALRAGGDDYMTKPFEPAELVARVRAHIHRHTLHREQVIRDALTGAYSHRHFKQALNQELRRLERGSGSLCLAMVDIDHFKRANDEHGHSSGDAILRGLVREALPVLRRTDILARYGGDEFAVVMPGTTSPEAAPLLERLAQTMAGARFLSETGQEMRATVSIGVSQWRAGIDPSSLIAQADQALYQAKTRGRNRLVVHDGAPAQAMRAEKPQSKPISILLVDDSRITRDLLKLYLRSMDVTLTDAENGAEALEVIRQGRPNLVLADLRMPKVGGIELCRAISEDPSTTGIPVVILTGHAEPEQHDACLKAGAKAVLTKPLEIIDLLNVVNRHLARC